MKKLFMLVTAAFLISGVSLAQDTTRIKEKRAATHSGKTCVKPVKTKKA